MNIWQTALLTFSIWFGIISIAALWIKR